MSFSLEWVAYNYFNCNGRLFLLHDDHRGEAQRWGEILCFLRALLRVRCVVSCLAIVP